jgi:hypothetical protein
MFTVRSIPDLRQRQAVQAVMPVSLSHLLRATTPGFALASLFIDSLFTPSLYGGYAGVSY